MSLVAREYALALDDALADRLSARERRLAWREVRDAIDSAALRISLEDGRVPPEDEDYHRALEAFKPPREAAAVFARRKPIYAAAVRRKRVVSVVILVTLVALGGLGWWFLTSEASEPVFTYAVGGSTLKYSDLAFFDVEKEYTRFEIVASGYVSNPVLVQIRDPGGEPVWEVRFTPDKSFTHGAIPAPPPGRYQLFLQFEGEPDARGIHVDVRGVYPT